MANTIIPQLCLPSSDFPSPPQRIRPSSQFVRHSQQSSCRFHALRPSVASQTSGHGMRLERLWEEFFADPSQWCDNRYKKKNPSHPDFENKTTKATLWIANRLNPPWVEAKLADMMQSQARASDRSISISASKPGVNCGARGEQYNRYVSTLCKKGRLKEALSILDVMDQQGVQVHLYTCGCLLKECINTKALPEGKRVHAHIMKSGLEQDSFVGSTLIRLYAKCGSMVDARLVFDKIFMKNSFSWNALIAGYVAHGHGEEALKLFQEMQLDEVSPDKFTITSILKACANLGALEEGKRVHAHIIKTGIELDVFIEAALVDMYAKCGSIEDARHVFDTMCRRDVVSWTVMITGYAKNGHSTEALKLFRRMQQEGRKPDLISWNALIKAYAQHGRADEARDLFREMQMQGVKPNVVSWNSMLIAYVQHGHVEQALELFQQMQLGGDKPNVVSWNAIIAGYAQQGRGEEAVKLFQQMQQEGVKPNVISWTVMISGYAQHGDCEEALELFQKMQCEGVKPDVISWNAMIAGYAQHGHGEEALEFFWQMQREGVKLDRGTFTSILNACASLAALEQGKLVHSIIIKTGLDVDLSVGTALVDMYAKCGSVDDALQVFARMSKRDVVTWNAMITGYALHGHDTEALQLFEQMQREGLEPDDITFTGVLSACSHRALICEGRRYFDSVSQLYGMTPIKEHYTCMIDLLGRVGCLTGAVDLISKMPFQPDVVVWRTLLAACRIHGKVELGEHAVECVHNLEPENTTSYVMLSNIYAAAGRWDDKTKVRKVIKDGG